MARVQCGQGAVRSDRLPEGVVDMTRASAADTVRSRKGAFDVDAESGARSPDLMRHPQWAQ